MTMLLLAAVASLVGTCTVQVGHEIHRARCRIAQDEEALVAVPIGQRQFAPGMLDISLEIVTSGYAAMRMLTPGGINSAGGELLLERNGVCWTGQERRVCLGRAVQRRQHLGRVIPPAYRGSWGLDEPGVDTARVHLSGSGVTDADGRSWTVTSVADDDGVLAIAGRATDDGTSRGSWMVALDPKGELLLGSPNSLPRR